MEYQAQHTWNTKGNLLSKSDFWSVDDSVLQKSIEIAGRLIFDSDEDFSGVSQNINIKKPQIHSKTSLFCHESDRPILTFSDHQPYQDWHSDSTFYESNYNTPQVLFSPSITSNASFKKSTSSPLILSSDPCSFDNRYILSADINQPKKRELSSDHCLHPPSCADENFPSLNKLHSMNKTVVGNSPTFVKQNDSQELFRNSIQRIESMQSIVKESSVTNSNSDSIESLESHEIFPEVELRKPSVKVDQVNQLSSAYFNTHLNNGGQREMVTNVVKEDCVPNLDKEDCVPNLDKEDCVPNLDKEDCAPNLDKEDCVPNLDKEDCVPNVEKEDCITIHSPKTLQEWEEYETERCSSSYVFVHLLDGIALELQRRISEKSDEINLIETVLHQYISASLDYVITMRSSFNQQQQQQQQQANNGVNDFSMNGQNILYMTESGNSINRYTDINEQDLNNTNTSGTIKIRGPQSPYTPAPVVTDLTAQSPPKQTIKKNKQFEKRELVLDNGNGTLLDGVTFHRVSGNNVKKMFSGRVSPQLRKSYQQSTNRMIKRLHSSPNNQHDRMNGTLQKFIQYMKIEVDSIEQLRTLSETEIIPTLNSLNVQYSNAGRLALDVLKNRSAQLKNKLLSSSKLWKDLKTGLVEVESYSQTLSLHPKSIGIKLWLLEKQYIDGVYRCREYQRQYLSSILQILEEIAELEDWMRPKLSGILSRWAILSSERWEATMKSLRGFHQLVDPDFYVKSKQASMCHLLQHYSEDLTATERIETNDKCITLPRFPIESSRVNKNEGKDEIHYQSMNQTDQRIGTPIERIGTPIERIGTPIERIGTPIERIEATSTITPNSPRWILHEGVTLLSQAYPHHLESSGETDFGTLPHESESSTEIREDMTPMNYALENRTPLAPFRYRNGSKYSTSIQPIPWFVPTSRETPSTVATPAEVETSSTSTIKAVRLISRSQSPKVSTLVPKSTDHNRYTKLTDHEEDFVPNDKRKDMYDEDRATDDITEFNVKRIATSSLTEQERRKRARSEGRRKNLADVISWLSKLPCVKENIFYSKPPTSFVPLINQATAMLSTPLCLVSTILPILECKALRLNGNGKLISGILEGASIDDRDQWQKVNIIVTAYHFLHVFEETQDENSEESFPSLWSVQLKHLEVSSGRSTKSSPEQILQLKDRSNNNPNTPKSVGQRFIHAVSRMALGQTRSCLLYMSSQDDLIKLISTLAGIDRNRIES